MTWTSRGASYIQRSEWKGKVTAPKGGVAEGLEDLGAMTVLLGDGRGGFRGGPVPLRTVSPGFVAVADVNGDRKPDLLATHLERKELTVLTGNGRVQTHPAVSSALHPGARRGDSLFFLDPGPLQLSG